MPNWLFWGLIACWVLWLVFALIILSEIQKHNANREYKIEPPIWFRTAIWLSPFISVLGISYLLFGT